MERDRELYRSRRPAAWRLPAGLAGCALALGVAPAAAAAPACAQPVLRAAEAGCESLASGGRERAYRLYVPAHPATGAALIVVLHGGGGTAAGMEALTERRFNRYADRAGALVVYPEGIGRRWNDGRDDAGAGAVAADVDDVGFLRELVATLATRFAVDHARVGVTGMSNGGMMTLRLACDAGDVFHGFVAVAASLGTETAAQCTPPAGLRLALIDGTADPVVPWGGGEVKVFARHHGAVIGAERTFAQFSAAAGCRGEAAGPPLAATPDDGTRARARRALRCAAGADVRLYEIDGGGHGWPGGLRYAREWLIGKVSRALDATDVVADFLAAVPGSRPAAE